jgi:hypothetical protein
MASVQSGGGLPEWRSPYVGKIFAPALLAFLAAPAFAQGSHADHGASKPVATSALSTQAFGEAPEAVMSEMAKVVLQLDIDPDGKKLAEDVIAAQEKEIISITDWLARRSQQLVCKWRDETFSARQSW